MIAVVVQETGGVKRRYEFDKHEIWIGRAPTCDIVLRDGTVGRQHCQLVEKDGRLSIVGTSRNVTYINGLTLAGAAVLGPFDKIYVGIFIAVAGLASQWPDDAGVTPIVEATEVRLLGEIAAGDENARSVYADWLDEHGRPDRAELLRLNTAYPSAPPGTRHAMWVRMHELAATIEPRWRLRVARPVIATCQNPICPKQWSALEPTERVHVRTCGTCTVTVVYCARMIDVATERGLRNIVAVDLPIEDPEPP